MMADSIIDQVYIVNLPERTDRRMKWEKQSDQLGNLRDKVIFFSAIDGKSINNTTNLKDGELGCSLSHLKIWEDAKKNGHKIILVMEDDVILKDGFDLALQELLKDIPEDFDWCYLYNSWDYRPAEDFSQKLLRVIASLGTVAYIVKISSLERIRPYVEELIFPIDVVMGHMSFLSKVYRPKNVFINHDESSPSNVAANKNVKTSFIKKISKRFKI